MSVKFTSFNSLFPDISSSDAKILQRITAEFPEIPEIALKFDQDFTTFMDLLRSSTIYRDSITDVKSQITEEDKLPSWFVKDVNNSDVVRVVKCFEDLTRNYKLISDCTEAANAAYNVKIADASHAVKAIREINEDLSVFILKLKSNDLTGFDNASFIIEEASAYKRLQIMIDEKAPAHHELLGEMIYFAELSVEKRTSLKKRIRNKLMDQFREKYYKLAIISADEKLLKHLHLVKSKNMRDILVPKNIRK
jgi:hypothetical protein